VSEYHINVGKKEAEEERTEKGVACPFQMLPFASGSL
jgi:hypothetical protein